MRVGRLGEEQSASFLEEVVTKTSVQEALEHNCFPGNGNKLSRQAEFHSSGPAMGLQNLGGLTDFFKEGSWPRNA